MFLAKIMVKIEGLTEREIALRDKESKLIKIKDVKEEGS